MSKMRSIHSLNRLVIVHSQIIESHPKEIFSDTTMKPVMVMKTIQMSKKEERDSKMTH